MSLLSAGMRFFFNFQTFFGDYPKTHYFPCQVRVCACDFREKCAADVRRGLVLRVAAFPVDDHFVACCATLRDEFADADALLENATLIEALPKKGSFFTIRHTRQALGLRTDYSSKRSIPIKSPINLFALMNFDEILVDYSQKLF